MQELTDGNIIRVDISDEMRKSYLDYAMSVIVGRALPDPRDGLKPVHRRILYAMHEAGLTPDKAFVKSVRVVGDVMAHYHPHGDAALYETLVRMAQNFSLRYPLVNGHGNFGSVDGDPPAAMRYTECKMTAIATWMLSDIEKQTVDFMPNFDGTTEEPVVLPSRFPNLLVNGSEGIAPAWATNIPPHNLGEVIDGAILLINDPEAEEDKLFRLVKGPDLPDGRPDRGPPGYPGRIPHRPRVRGHARPGADRAVAQRQAPPGRQGDPVPGQQGQTDRAHRRPLARADDRRHYPPPRRIRPRGHAHRASRPAATSTRTSS